MNLTIEFKDKGCLAHEVVFPDDIHRTVPNAFRFALKSYLYYKGRALFEFSLNSDISNNTISRQLGCGKNVNLLIKYDTAKAACDFFDIDIIWLYSIAEQFVKYRKYNAIGFNEQGNVIFFKAFQHIYSHAS